MILQTTWVKSISCIKARHISWHYLRPLLLLSCKLVISKMLLTVNSL